MTDGEGTPVTIVFVDADNTLWDTDQIFADAQIGLLADAELSVGTRALTNDRLAFVRAIDQEIAHRHHAGLRYPPRILAKATAMALGGTPVEAAARSARLGTSPGPLSETALATIERRYLERLEQIPALRAGIFEGMTALRTAGCELLIVSESARAKVEAIAMMLGLAGLFSRVIEGSKRPELYTRILKLLGSPERAFMIGDQLDRDIAPAKAAGLSTIYFPGRFTPRWTPDEALTAPDYRVGDFREVVDIVLGRQGASRPAALGN